MAINYQGVNPGTGWVNAPSTATPRNAANLNIMNTGTKAACDGVDIINANLIKYAIFYLSSAQSIPDSATTQIIWGSKSSYNSEDFCEIDAATGKIKITKTGMYQLCTMVQFASNSTGKRTYYGIMINEIFAGNASVYLSTSEFVYVTAGTLLNNRVIQTSGGALNILAGGNTMCHIRKVF